MADCHGCNGECRVDGEVCKVCKGAGVNGVDLSIDAGRDASIKRELNPPPCCARLARGQWCQLPDGHNGEHYSSAALDYGPTEAFPRLWRVHKGLR